MPVWELAFWPMLFFLLVWHSLADFPLQGDWMVHSKVRSARQPSSSSARPDLIWVHVLTAHCMVHGGGVALITGSIWLGIAEIVAHWLTDFAKGEGLYGFHTDQALHIGAKFLWAYLAVTL
ncbi:MAG: DUF3307 domain-containing protein [Salinisphaeraceae bacterium]|nr:DUF3307 domain-containing protein [Salinisphaeraceae bacterium]